MSVLLKATRKQKKTKTQLHWIKISCEKSWIFSLTTVLVVVFWSLGHHKLKYKTFLSPIPLDFFKKKNFKINFVFFSLYSSATKSLFLEKQQIKIYQFLKLFTFTITTTTTSTTATSTTTTTNNNNDNNKSNN